MVNHTQAEPMGILTNVLCQVGVTTIISKFVILDIDQDASIVVGRGFLYTIGGIVNTPERLFSTFDGIFHQTFYATRSNVLRTAESDSDSDDEEEYEIKRNKFGAPIYGLKPAAYLNCNDPAERSLALKAVIHPFWKISAEPMGILTNVLCQVGVTTIISKFVILDIDQDASIVVGRGFLYTIGGIVNTPERLFSTFDGIFHQTFYATRSNVLRTAESDSDSDDEEEYEIKRNKFGAPIYGLKPAAYLNCNDPAERSLALKATMGGNDDEARSSRFKRSRQYKTVKELYEEGFDVYIQGGLCGDDHFNAEEYWLNISRDENLSLSRSYVSNIRSPVLRNDLWLLSMFDARHQNGYANVVWLITWWMKRKGAATQKESQICCGEFIKKIARKARVLSDVVLRSLSALIYCRDLDTTTLRELINSEGRLILEDPWPGVPRVSIPRP
uniref:Uncharacterized protein n=1 Tax=Tanacetum cinerariifolium TaxID=118510 RepID=A0A6L2LM27_TANCI|nr:hypothetical protein [Tanacetum cinerariifolium]